jgi:hypothetical protein
MHNEHNITSDWIKLLQSISDEFIIEMTSRGLFNRIMNSEINVDIQSIEEHLIVLKVEGVEVKIADNIEKSTCSCDKVIKCKHIISSLIFLRNLTIDQKSEPVALTFSVSKQQLLEDFSVFHEDLKQTILESLVYMDKFDFKENRNIIVKDYNDTTVIYYNSDFSNALCSCKKNKCDHSFTNKYAYAMHKKIIHLSDLQKPKMSQKELKQLKHLKEKLLELIHNGILQTSKTEVYTLEQIAHNDLSSKVLRTQLEHVISMINHHLENINFYPLYILAEHVANLVILIDVLVENKNDDISSIVKLDEVDNYKKTEVKEISLIYLGYYFEYHSDSYKINKLYLHPKNQRFYLSTINNISFYESNTKYNADLNRLLLHNITIYKTNILNREIEYKKTQLIANNFEIDASLYSTDINNARKMASSIADLFSYEASMFFFLHNIEIVNVSFMRESLKLIITILDHEKNSLVIEHMWNEKYSERYQEIEKTPDLLFKVTSIITKYVANEHKFIFLFGYNKYNEIFHIER